VRAWVLAMALTIVTASIVAIVVAGPTRGCAVDFRSRDAPVPELGGGWEVYMTNGPQQHKEQLRLGKNKGGCGDLVKPGANPMSGAHKMAEATFDARGFTEVLAVGNDGSWAHIKRTDGGAIPAADAFKVGAARGYELRFSDGTRRASPGNDPWGAQGNHGPFFVDVAFVGRVEAGQWMWCDAEFGGKSRPRMGKVLGTKGACFADENGGFVWKWYGRRAPAKLPAAPAPVELPVVVDDETDCAVPQLRHSAAPAAGVPSHAAAATTTAIPSSREEHVHTLKAAGWSEARIARLSEPHITRFDNGKDGPESHTMTTYSTFLIDEIMSSKASASVALALIPLATDESLRFVRRVAWTSSKSLDMSMGDDFLKNALEYAIDAGLSDVAAALRARGVRTCALFTAGMEVRDPVTEGARHNDLPFAPARLDFNLTEDGAVDVVAGGGQAERMGVARGWKLMQIDGEYLHYVPPLFDGATAREKLATHLTAAHRDAVDLSFWAPGLDGARPRVDWEGAVATLRTAGWSDARVRAVSKVDRLTRSTPLLDVLVGAAADPAVLLAIIALSDDVVLRAVHSRSSFHTKNALEHALDDVRLVEVAAALDARGVRTCKDYTPGMDIRDPGYPRPRFMRAQFMIAQCSTTDVAVPAPLVKRPAGMQGVWEPVRVASWENCPVPKHDRWLYQMTISDDGSWKGGRAGSYIENFHGSVKATCNPKVHLGRGQDCPRCTSYDCRFTLLDSGELECAFGPNFAFKYFFAREDTPWDAIVRLWRNFCSRVLLRSGFLVPPLGLLALLFFALGLGFGLAARSLGRFARRSVGWSRRVRDISKL